jgi:hypothetical protein
MAIAIGIIGFIPTGAAATTDAVLPAAFSAASVAARSMLQEQDEATRARRYRFGEQSERKKFTFYLELEKFQVDGGRNYYPTSLNFVSLALLS